jgi:(2Fe-2S) ferredoxin
MPLEIPQVYKYHAFCCFQQRPPGHPRGSCSESGAKPLWDRLFAKLESEGLMADVGMTPAGCLGFCNAGPLMVVYPEGIWYQPRTLDDIDEIVSSHFVNGKPVAELIIVPRR